MSAKDMAKIGLSCLNNGYYEGNQIVPLKWRREMTTFREVNSGNFSRISMDIYDGVLILKRISMQLLEIVVMLFILTQKKYCHRTSVIF